MIKSINFEDFKKAFKDYNRENQFEHTLEMLFEEIETIEQDTGEQYELDVIELCVEWTEQSLADVAEEEGVTTQDVIDTIENIGNDHLITEHNGEYIAVMLNVHWDEVHEELQKILEENNQEINEGIADTIEMFSDELNTIARQTYDRTDKINLLGLIAEIEEVFEELRDELTEHNYND